MEWVWRKLSSLALGRLALLEERVNAVELQLAADRLEILDTCEKVARQLVDRRRKRDPMAAVDSTKTTPVDRDSRFLGAMTRFGKS